MQGYDRTAVETQRIEIQMIVWNIGKEEHMLVIVI